MSLILQDPNASTPNLLLDELERYFKDADAIYCAFAFVTARGVNLLFEQDAVKANLKHAKTHLIVGMDAITDTKAIEEAFCPMFKLQEYFRASIFVSRGGYFSPKI